jgi:hypothetical protein
MNRAKSITKLVDSKSVTDAKISKYVLTTQEQVNESTVNPCDIISLRLNALTVSLWTGFGWRNRNETL